MTVAHALCQDSAPRTPWRPLEQRLCVASVKAIGLTADGAAARRLKPAGAGHNATAVFESEAALQHVFRHISTTGAPGATPAAAVAAPAAARVLPSRYRNIAALLALQPDDDDE